MNIKEACKIFNITYNKEINNKEIIKTIYKKLAIKHHPDKENGDEEIFKQVQDAYDILKVYIFNEERKTTHHTIQSKRKRRGTRPLEPRDVVISVNVTVRELYKGFDQMVMYSARSICQHCNNRGCHLCSGSLLIVNYNVEVRIDSVLINKDLEIIYEGLGDQMYEKGDLVIKLIINNDEFDLDCSYSLPAVTSNVKVSDEKEITIETLDGPVIVNIENVDYSKPLRLKSKGLKYQTSDGNIVRGDHLIKLIK